MAQRRVLVPPATADAALSQEFLTRVLRSLVRTPSVNPGVLEAAMAETVAGWLSGIDAELTYVESLPGRHSVAAELRGSEGTPRLVLNGHMDTVPVDDLDLWTTEPYGAQIRDGFMYGRGACDMKAGLAVQIGVARYLAAKGERLKGSLILHFAVGEERGEPGTLSLVGAGFGGDFGITTEPTGLRVATATRGLAFYRIRIEGRSIHASRSHLGLNPIPELGTVLKIIEEYQEELAKRLHPLLASGSCTPTVLRAGVAENAVPDYCEVFLDRRLLPGETVEGELEALDMRLEAARHAAPEFGFTVSTLPNPFEPAEINNSSPLAQRLLHAIEAETGRSPELYGAPFASDVRNLVNDAAMEALTFGPGNVAECHCPDERVALQDVEDAARVIARVAEELLIDVSGGEPDPDSPPGPPP